MELIYLFLLNLETIHKWEKIFLISSSVKYTDSQNKQPLLGVILINKDIDYSKLKSKEYFDGIMIYKFTHILGFSN